MITTRRTALLSGLATVAGAFVPRLFRRGLPAPAKTKVRGHILGVGGRALGTCHDAGQIAVTASGGIGTARLYAYDKHGRVFAAKIADGFVVTRVALRPDGTVGPA